MNKNTSNKLFVLFLTLFTISAAFFILGTLGLNTTFSIIISVIIGSGLYSAYSKQQKPMTKKNNNTELQPVSKKREKYYQSRGLSDEDIVFFRETMNNTKKQILQIENNINQVGKLKAISNRNNTLNLIKVLFKDIVNEPERLNEIDQFLYVHLPSLAELTEKYVQINLHQEKSKQTFDILEKSAQTIDNICQEISKDYLNFRSTDINDLADEMDLAKRRLDREGSDIEDDEI